MSDTLLMWVLFYVIARRGHFDKSDKFTMDSRIIPSAANSSGFNVNRNNTARVSNVHIMCTILTHAAI